MKEHAHGSRLHGPVFLARLVSDFRGLYLDAAPCDRKGATRGCDQSPLVGKRFAGRNELPDIRKLPTGVSSDHFHGLEVHHNGVGIVKTTHARFVGEQVDVPARVLFDRSVAALRRRAVVNRIECELGVFLDGGGDQLEPSWASASIGSSHRHESAFLSGQVELTHVNVDHFIRLDFPVSIRIEVAFGRVQGDDASLA